MNSDLEMFDLLENAGALCRSVVNKGQNTLLHSFCCYKHNDEQLILLEKLINKGCDVNAENGLRRTPLMLAAKLDMVDTCRILLNANADIDKTDYKGYRAIDFTERGSQCYRLLEERTNIQKLKSKLHNTEQTYRRKNPISTYGLSMQTSKSTNHLDFNETNRESYVLDTNMGKKTLENQQSFPPVGFHSSHCHEESHSKYKSMWEKLLQKNQNKQRTRDLSLQRPMSSSYQSRKELSQQKTQDLSKKQFINNIKL